MAYTTLQNTPITIDLTQQGNSRGWTIVGGNAVHETCNSGLIKLISYPIVAGVSYEFSYTVLSINSGSIISHLGGVTGLNTTTTGFKTETITAINNSPLDFFSNANCEISPVTIRITTSIFNPKAQNTIAWSEKDNKWSDWRGYIPDCGYSLFANMFTYKNGALYRHALDNTRNLFYGQQYPSILRFVANQGQGQPKTFESISYEANRLLVTTTSGITTSLGQLSELVDVDFLKTVLDDGVTQINVYNSEGIYSAGFMRDKNVDIVNGDVLKGTYITVELITVDTGILKLKNVYINSISSKIGSR